MSLLSRLIVLCCALMTALPAAALGTRHMAVSLEAGPVAATGGGSARLAIVMRPEAGWHGYWKNPGDAGVETRAAWTMPAGMTAGPLLYPVPTTLLVGGLMNYVYEGDHALLVDLKLPSSVTAGQRLPVSAKLDYLVCTKELCVPESATVSTQLVIGSRGESHFARWEAALPKPLGAPAQFMRQAGSLRLGIPFPAEAKAENTYFFPLAHGAIDYAAPQRVGREGDRLVIETKAADGQAPGAIEGVLRIAPGQGLTLTATPGSVPAIEEQPSNLARAIVIALGGAILGGLILNVMPCVFPIVSLKALSLARAGGDERAARREALAYAAGVIATCVALGAIILGARAAGASLGWAFQLQNPWIVFALLLLAAVITLNLAGVVELRAFGGGQALVEKGGTRGAFWTGVLAAFVATPCTGPFMAAALGAALVLPVAAAIAVFAGLGLGIALPFLAIGFVPALRRRLPRPGAWMATFQRILAVPMALTVVALLWLIDRAQGPQAFQWGVIAVLLLAIGAIAAGRRPPRWVGATLAVVLALGVAVIKLPIEPAQAATPAAFSETALETARKNGQPVFLYFTADWCVTCKVNERGAIERAEVRTAFAEKGVTVMMGDWTNGDPVITRFLQAHGAFGVPLYLYYAPGAAEPEVLPQVLTPALLTRLAS